MREKTVLVTGGAGFIGSHLVRRLIQEGARVTVVVKYRSMIDSVRFAPVWDDIGVVEADLRNLDSARSLSKNSYDIVYHLAAYNHVGDSFIHVQESILSNILATANLLEAGLEYGRFVYTASSEVYGLQKSVPFAESSMPFPISPYAVGKYGGELYARMKHHQTGGEIICLRPFNTFGPYQSERAVIPELISKCLRGETVETTAGRQTREFNYVGNIIDGFVAAGTVAKAPAGPVNIGSGEEIAIADLVRLIHRLTESESELRIGALADRPTEIWRMFADAGRARDLLGWEPRVDFETGMRLTVNWFRSFLEVYRGPTGLAKL